MIESDTEVLADEFKKNYAKWRNDAHKPENVLFELSEPEANNTSQKESAEYLLGWLQTRIEFLNSQWHK